MYLSEFRAQSWPEIAALLHLRELEHDTSVCPICEARATH